MLVLLQFVSSNLPRPSPDVFVLFNYVSSACAFIGFEVFAIEIWNHHIEIHLFRMLAIFALYH